MNCSRARVPSLHHSKEGWLPHKSNVAKPPLLAQTGWFSLRVSIGKPPRPRGQRTPRYFLDRSATPPCCDARRGLLHSCDTSRNQRKGGHRPPLQGRQDFYADFRSSRDFL